MEKGQSPEEMSPKFLEAIAQAPCINISQLIGPAYKARDLLDDLPKLIKLTAYNQATLALWAPDLLTYMAAQSPDHNLSQDEIKTIAESGPPPLDLEEELSFEQAEALADWFQR